MRRRIARQNPDVHPDALAGETHEPFHRSTDIMGAARRGIDPGADAAADDASLGIDIITVDARPVVLVLLEDGEAAGGRTVATLSGLDRTVDSNFVAGH